jgi:hypothetical protein
MIHPFFKRTMHKIHEINRKYSEPQIRMTPLVRYSLLSLRFYLLLLVGILVFKFITLVY